MSGKSMNFISRQLRGFYFCVANLFLLFFCFYIILYKNFSMQSYYNIFGYIPCVVHDIPVTYLFYGR